MMRIEDINDIQLMYVALTYLHESPDALLALLTVEERVFLGLPLEEDANGQAETSEQR